MAKLDLLLTVGKGNPDVVLTLAPQPTIDPSLQSIVCSVDSAAPKSASWKPETELSCSWKLKPGQHRLSISFGETFPVGVVTLPNQTKALASVLPLLVNVEDGKAAHDALIWNPKTPPLGLSEIIPSFFARNTQLTGLPGTFSGLLALHQVPEALFFPLIYAKNFENLFRGSGISQVSELLFNANTVAENFAGAFSFCKELLEVPETLFAANQAAKRFDQAFADSGLTKIPAGLFQQVKKNASFIETFARTDIVEVPSGLFTHVEPRNIDGIFEPKSHCDHDPMHIKAGPRFHPDFFSDTRDAMGVATSRKRS